MDNTIEEEEGEVEVEGVGEEVEEIEEEVILIPDHYLKKIW